MVPALPSCEKMSCSLLTMGITESPSSSTDVEADGPPFESKVCWCSESLRAMLARSVFGLRGVAAAYGMCSKGRVHTCSTYGTSNKEGARKKGLASLPGCSPWCL